MGRSAYQQWRVSEGRRARHPTEGSGAGGRSETPDQSRPSSRRIRFDGYAGCARSAISKNWGGGPPISSPPRGAEAESPVGHRNPGRRGSTRHTRAVRIGRTPGWRVEYCARGAACLVAAQIDDVVAVGACKFMKLLRSSKRRSAKVTVDTGHLWKVERLSGHVGYDHVKYVLWRSNSEIERALVGIAHCGEDQRASGAAQGRDPW